MVQNGSLRFFVTGKFIQLPKWLSDIDGVVRPQKGSSVPGVSMKLYLSPGVLCLAKCSTRIMKVYILLGNGLGYSL